MPKNRRNSRASERSSSEESHFVVEVVKAARVNDGEWEYRVKWANYDSAEDTWEPTDNLDKCQRLLASFWADIGLDNKDYPEGYEVRATPSWIKREKKLFARNQAAGASSQGEDSDDMEAASSHMKDIRDEPSASKGKGKDTIKPSKGKKRSRPSKISNKPRQDPQVDHAEESDDAPLSRIPRKIKKRTVVALTSDEADDDEPLAKHRQPRPSKSKNTSSVPSVGNHLAPQEPAHDSGSESAGSLFSGKESSPDVAPQGASASTSTAEKPSVATIPMKRPATEDGVPSHRRRRLIKEMAMVITETAGNSTKARLAQRGLQTATPPAPAPAASTTEAGVGPQKLNLSAFSFKKKSATVGGPSSAPTDSPTISGGPTTGHDHVQSPVSPVLPTPNANMPTIAPIPRTTEIRRTTVPIPRRTSVQSVPQDPMAEANKFLANIMPTDLAAPMNEELTPTSPTTPSIPEPPGKNKSIPLPRIGKKWRWSGELFMDVSPDKAEQVCEITLHDPTEPLPNGLRFSICVKGDSLRFSAFHDISSLPLFLEACARVQQFAKVGPHEDKDTDAVTQLGIYMTKRSLFCYAHLYVEDTSVALLIMFPSGHPEATKYLKVLRGAAGDALLQAALVPWELKAKDFQNMHWKTRLATQKCLLDPDFTSMLDKAGSKVVSQRRFYQALHILGFSKSLYDFMAAPNHPYCIWYIPGDRIGASVGYETLLLKEILSTCTSPDVGYNGSARVVFVHVGALDRLHNLPALVDRRAKHADWRFITYGTHPSVPRERWGMRELFPIGGIVTFTPSAIVSGHFRILERIKQIAEHPMWECYVLPSVVAMVAKLSCQGMHPLQVYDEGNFVYEHILTAIEDGSLALLQAPRSIFQHPTTEDPTLLWTRWMFRIAGKDARGILEECLNLAAEQFGNTSEADLPVAIEKEIARDLLRMQSQPALIDNYRRFVVFRTNQDTFFSDSSKHGFECTSYDQFDFRDDFFNEAPRGSEKK
ncbi:hypothetical protein BC628DRAFT_1379753 [Trametes gibbosa]|nr:hypothetical protein BC628DRAFT_1379753 [Trametes gibbosa]